MGNRNVKLKNWIFVLVLVLVCFCCITAIAESSGTCGNNLKWTLDDNGLLVISGTGYLGYSFSTVNETVNVIKQVIISNGVTGIGNYVFKDCSELTSITIPDGVTSIGGFSGCSGLTSITIPDSVTTIDGGAFEGCSGLTSITIPDGVTSIGDNTFSGCSGLTSITIPDGVTSIGNYAFKDCSCLTSITIPDDVTSIGINAFEGCSELTSITISDNILLFSFKGSNPTDVILRVKTGKGLKNIRDLNPDSIKQVDFIEMVENIGENAFSGCSGLTSITIPESVTSIKKSAFSDCSGLTSITIPDSVTSIETGAFSGCKGLTSITIPDSVTSIGGSAFSGCSGLASITIPDSVTSISGYTFWNCSGLTSITIPDGVTSIGSSAFSYCSGLTSITIPDSVTIIGDSVFKGCSGLTSITIPDDVTSIGTNTFDDCSGLTSITISDNILFSLKGSNPTDVILRVKTGKGLKNIRDLNPDSIKQVDFIEMVENIGVNAFSGCSGLTSITIPDGVTSIGNYAFKDCSGLTSITIPDGVTSIGSSAFRGCSGLTSITIPNGVTSIGSSVFSDCSGLTSITIPDSVITIDAQAFYGCSGLTSITIPDSVTTIDAQAFYGCSGLKSITMQDSVTSIGSSAFEGCSGLTSITIPDGVTSINQATFADCSGLESITIPDEVTSIGRDAFYRCSGLTSITIPDGVTSIEIGAFNGCSGLKSITIPDGATSIKNAAFKDCSGLKSITIPDGMSSIAAGAFINCGAKRYATIGSEGSRALSAAGLTFTVKGYEKLSLIYNTSNYEDLILDSVEQDVKNLAIPSGVTNIKFDAMKGCINLQGIVIPEGVRIIGSGMMTYYDWPEPLTGLEAVIIPDSVTSIICDLFDSKTVIYCHEYTVAEKWANENNHKVVLLDSQTEVIEPVISIEEAITMKLGTTYDDLASVFPYELDTVISYASADDKIVRVADDGKIIPVSTGETTITVSANGISKTSEVTVIQQATSFVIPSDIYVLAKGNVDVVATDIMPENATLNLNWKLDSTTYANVDQNGRISGGAIGETTLTVTDSFSGLSYNSTVHVVRPVSKIEFEKKEVSVDQDDTIALKAAVYMGTQTAMDNTMVEFSTSDPGIATVSDKGIVTGISPGKVTITATSENGISDSCTVNVIGSPLKEPEIEAPDYLKQGTNLEMTLSGNGIEFAIVTIIDAEGNQVSQQKIDGTTIEVATNTLSNGTYTVEVQAGSDIRQASKPTTVSIIVNNLGDDPAATTDTSLKIVWSDQDNIDGLRPKQLAYSLNDAEVNPSVTDWTAVVTNLPKYEGDTTLEYSWTVSVPDGYTQVAKQTEGYLTTITLEHIHTHQYQATYGWSETESACEVTLVCGKGDSTETLKAEVKSEETTPATCTAEGEATLTATLTYEGKTYTDSITRTIGMIPHETEVTKAGSPATCTEDGNTDELTCKNCHQIIQESQKIAALGHEYGEPVFAWEGTTGCTATFTCKRNEEHKETIVATITSEVTTQPSELNKGITTYTATVKLNEKVYTDQKAEADIPPLLATTFDTFKETQIKAAQNLGITGDSADSQKLIEKAVATIGALTYDNSKTAAENKAAVEEILTKLSAALETQRATDQQEANKASFVAAKTDQKAKADALAQAGDSASSQALIVNAKAAIDALQYDENKTAEQNKAEFDSILTKLSSDLAVQRAADAAAAEEAVKPTLKPGTYTVDGGVYEVRADGTAIYVKPEKVAATIKVLDEVPASVAGIAAPVTEIKDKAFSAKDIQKKMKTLNIGRNVEIIGKNAAAGCISLKTVKGGAGLKIIKDNAFSGCTAMTKFTFGKNVTSIGKKAFSKNAKLKTLKFQGTGKLKVGSGAFEGIAKDAKTTVPKNVEKTYTDALRKKGKMPGKINGK